MNKSKKVIKKEYDRIYHLKHRAKRCAISRRYYLVNKDVVRERTKKYYLANRDKFLKRTKENKQKHLLADPNYREYLRQYARESYARRRNYYKTYKVNPIKKKARAFLYNAIKYNKIKRPNFCEKCNTKCIPEGHHFMGYNNPLQVIWLCTLCHSSIHH